jgi:zinc/manganese transport system substrate-binding protein
MNRIAIVAALTLFAPWMASAKLNIVTTTPDLAAIARDITGELATVNCIGRTGEDPHFIEAKPSHIVTLNKADVLIEVGMELEIGWLPALLDQTRNAKIRPGATGRINASKFITPIEVPTGKVDRSQGDVHAHGNPHYLLDPMRGLDVARGISARLATLDAANADAYRQKLADFEKRVRDCCDACLIKLHPYRGAKVFSYHNSLSYLMERYGLNVVNTIEPKPGIPPSPSHIATVIDQGTKENIRVILIEKWHDRRVPALIAGKLNGRTVVLATQPDSDYVAFTQAVCDQLAAALSAQ